MDKYLILLNKIPLSNIYKDPSNSLIIIDYYGASGFVGKFKK